MVVLNLFDSFSQFDAIKLLRLSELYPHAFDNVEKMTLEHQFNIYYDNVQKKILLT